MSDQGKIEKIHKLDTKHKTASIIKLMEGKHSDTSMKLHIIWSMKIRRSVPKPAA